MQSIAKLNLRMYWLVLKENIKLVYKIGLERP